MLKPKVGVEKVFVHLYSVLELKVNSCTNKLAVCQYCSRYHRRTQNGAHIPAHTQTNLLHYTNTNYSDKASEDICTQKTV